jgi:hypothetical protein
MSCLPVALFKTNHVSIRFPDKLIFNKEVRIDLVFLSGKPAFSIVDVGTNFVASRLLSGEDTETILDTFYIHGL